MEQLRVFVSHTHTDNEFCGALGLGAAVLAGILHGMVDSAYFEPDLALLLWWAVAVLLLMMVSESVG